MKRIITVCLIIFSLLFSSLGCWGEEAAREALFGSSGGKSAWEILVGNSAGSTSNSAESARENLLGESTSLTGNNGAYAGKKPAKQELTYKGIPLRITTQKLRDLLAEKSLVPSYEFDSKAHDRTNYRVTYSFDDFLFGFPVHTDMLFSFITAQGQQFSPGQLVRIEVLYDGLTDLTCTFQSVYDSLKKNLIDYFGDNYTVNGDTLTWSNFMNADDELTMEKIENEEKILLQFTDTYQLTLLDFTEQINKQVQEGKLRFN